MLDAHPGRLWLHLGRGGPGRHVSKPGRSLRGGHRLLGKPLHRRQDQPDGGHGGQSGVLLGVSVRAGLDGGTGDIYAVAGTGTACSTHTPAGCLYNALATSAKLDAPSGVATDSSGNLYIADTTNQMVAMVARAACSSACPFGLASTVTGDIYAVAGTGTACSTHTPAGCLYNALATSAKLDAPGGVAVDSAGNLYIADTTDQMVAMVARAACSSACPFGLASTVTGDIYAVAGTGTACSTHTPAGCGYTSGGVAQTATAANLDAPGGVAVDSAGNLYIADTTDQMVAMVASIGVLLVLPPRAFPRR